MAADPLVGWAFSSVLLALRIGPVFAFAPPFTLTRVPAVLRAPFALAVAAALVGGNPGAAARGRGHVPASPEHVPGARHNFRVWQ